MTARRIRPAYQPRVYPVARFAVGDRVRAVGVGMPAGVGWITLAWWPPWDDPAPGWRYAVEWRAGGRGMAREDELRHEGEGIRC